MADVITRFKLETTQYDSALRDASKSLSAYAKKTEAAGKDFTNFSQKAVEAARSLGTIASGANNTKDKLKDLVGAYNDVAKTYNKLTEQQRQTDFGKAMSQSLEQLQVRIKETKQELYGLGDTVKNAGGGLFSGVGDKMSGALQVFAGNMLTKAAGAVANLGSEIFSSVQQGVELAKQGEGIRMAFERLGRGDILDGLREATHGTVTDLELMKAAVKFNDFKLPLDELGTMLAFAQQKAKDTGQSVDYMVDSIVTGLGRKSLMILDNLGLSANEVKEKMKETGDMTKAVGEIIREQMSKAGDYVETAADRATKADVDLKNAMEDLGRTFQPLSDAGASMWNSLKIGALDLLNNAVKPLIDALTEAGRIRSQFAEQGGDMRVNRMLGRLGEISNSQYRKNTYNSQLANFDTKIGSYQQYLADYKKWQSDKTAVGAYDRMQAFQKQTGLSMYSDVKEQLAVFKKMRAEYVNGAKAILEGNPAPSPIEPSKTNGGGKGGSTGGNTDSTFAEGSIAAQSKLVQDLTKQWNEAGEDVRNSYLFQLIAAEKKLKEMKDQQQALKDFMSGDAKGVAPVGIAENLLPDLKAIEEELAKNPIKLHIEIDEDKIKSIKSMAALQKTASDTAKVVGSIGEAFNAIEDPAAKVAGTVAQAIANIALGYSQAMLTPKDPISWIAFGATGLAQMLTMISAIHSSTGYAEGGIVKGNSYSGDNIMANGGAIGLNAGELVLNKAQQSTLASELQNGGNRIQVVGRLSGEQLFLCAENWSKRTGKGEFVTW